MTIVDYNAGAFLFCKLGFFFDFLDLDNKGILDEFGSVLYKHISISCHSKVVLDFSISFYLLSTGFKREILDKKIGGFPLISSLVLAKFTQYFDVWCEIENKMMIKKR